MAMKAIFYVGLGLLTTISAHGTPDKDTPRSVENVNQGWRFHKGAVDQGCEAGLDDSRWETVSIPHTWNVDDSFDTRGSDDGFDITFGYYRGPAWYRKTIFVPKEDEGRRLHVRFEAANKVADVWVNGQHVGNHIGGYSGFQFDITPYVAFGEENLIAVRVDNSYNYDIPPQSADYTMYGGIYRDAYLVKTAPAYIRRAQIATPEVSDERAALVTTALLVNTAETEFTGELEIVITDPHGVEVAATSVPVALGAGSSGEVAAHVKDLPRPLLWSPDSPSLYAARVRLKQEHAVADAITERFGLRWFSFDPDKGFFLNGKRLQLKGVNRHQDRQGYGNALPNSLHVKDIEMIKSMGANFLRLAHYPQDPAVLDACDRLGLLVWEEIPVVRSVGKERFRENAKVMLREMITEHYNHPSVIVWGLMNEVIRRQPKDQLHWSVELCQELHDLAHQLDPYRKTVQAQYKEEGTNIGDITDIRGWNRYFGWYYGSFEDFGPFIDEERQRYPHRMLIISEYGAGSGRGRHVETPARGDFSEEWQVAFHKAYWRQISERPWIAGSCAWLMFDFASDEKGGSIRHINQKGLVDFGRNPKDVFYFYQSVWTEEPMVYIVSHTWLERSGERGESKAIEVFSNCDRVELFLNEVSLGSKTAPFTWDVVFEEGKNGLHAVGMKEDTAVEDAISVTYTVAQ